MGMSPIYTLFAVHTLVLPQMNDYVLISIFIQKMIQFVNSNGKMMLYRNIDSENESI